MQHLSPTTLTHAEQRTILRATAKHPRDHLIYSLAIGTGLRLSELVGLNVDDVFSPDGAPRYAGCPVSPLLRALRKGRLRFPPLSDTTG